MFLLSWWRASAPANRGHKRTPPIMLTTGPEKPKPEHERERPDRRIPIVALVFEFLRFATSRACYAQILCRYFTIFSFRFSVLTASTPGARIVKVNAKGSCVLGCGRFGFQGKDDKRVIPSPLPPRGGTCVYLGNPRMKSAATG